MSDDMTDFDPFDVDTSSGLITEFTGEIVGSEFLTDPKYNDGNTLLLRWTLAILDEDLVESGIVERQVSFSCGDKWESPDGGETAVFGDGERAANFRANSRMGMLVSRAFRTGEHVDGEGEGEKAELAEPVELSFGLVDEWRANNASPMMASPWVGYVFRFRRHYHDYGGSGDQKIGVRSFDMPVELVSSPYSGEVEADEPAEAPPVAVKKKAAKKGAAKKKAAAKKAAPKQSEEEFIALVHGMIEAMGEDEGFDEYVTNVTAMLSENGHDGNASFVAMVTSEEAPSPWSEWQEEE